MLGIRIIGDQVLRKVAEDVTVFDEDLETLAQEMIETMHESDGIGLAAPQVGISKQLLVTDISSIDARMGPMVFVNPEILDTGGEVTMEEGCLSIPNVREDVTRPETIVLKYQTVDGEEKTETFDGWMSRVLQHEIDHLHGVLFTDYLSPVKQKLLLADLQA
jgi:peptide deformylase